MQWCNCTIILYRIVPPIVVATLSQTLQALPGICWLNSAEILGQTHLVFAAPAQVVVSAAVKAIATASTLLELPEQEETRPRGVVPECWLTPLRNMSLAQCAQAVGVLGQRLAEELDMGVSYGPVSSSCTSYAAGHHPANPPAAPTPASCSVIHPTAGSTRLAAARCLMTYQLEVTLPALAQATRLGTHVQKVSATLPAAELLQVAPQAPDSLLLVWRLTDYAQTTPYNVLQTMRPVVAAGGGKIKASQIKGPLLPEVLKRIVCQSLASPALEAHQVLPDEFRGTGAQLTVGCQEFWEQISTNAVPGVISASALNAAWGAALAAKLLKPQTSTASYRLLQAVRWDFSTVVVQEQQAQVALKQAEQMEDTDPELQARLATAGRLKKVLLPFNVMHNSLQVLRLLATNDLTGSHRAELAVTWQLTCSALQSAALLIEAQLPALGPDEDFTNYLVQQIRFCREQSKQYERRFNAMLASTTAPGSC